MKNSLGFYRLKVELSEEKLSLLPCLRTQCSFVLLWSKNLTVLSSICSTNHRASCISARSNSKSVIVTISNWSLISTCHIYTIWSSYFKFLKIWKNTSIYHVICQWSSCQRPAVNHLCRVSGKTHQIIGISSPSTNNKALEIQLIWSLLPKTHRSGFSRVSVCSIIDGPLCRYFFCC